MYCWNWCWVKKVFTAIFVYAPQSNMSEDRKVLWQAYCNNKFDEKEVLLVAGNLNDHVGKTSGGLVDIHAGNGHGDRITEVFSWTCLQILFFFFLQTSC